MPRKSVIPAAVADALTAEKPPSAPSATVRTVSVLASDDLALKDVETLAFEVIALQMQGAKCLFEVGRRLIAAKERLSHGDWLPWLESVRINDRLAQRYMRLAREWSSNPTILTDLGMSKALSLLALPESVRDEFVAEAHIVDGEEKSVVEMSNKELSDAIRARQKAEAELDTVKCRLAEAERLRTEAEQDADKTHGDLIRANQRLELAQKETADVRELLKAEQQARFDAADELAALKAKPVDVAIEKVVDPEAIEAAKEEGRNSVRRLADEANAERDRIRINLDKTRANLESVTKERDAEQERANAAQQDLDAARKDAENVRQELERVKAEKTPIADKDLSLFSVLFEQTQAAINKMHGIILKLPPDRQESTRKVLSALADNIRKAVES